MGFSDLYLMPTIIEPIEARLIVALINRYIINNHRLWEYLCPTQDVPEAKHSHELVREDASSTTTSVNDAEIHMHHAY